MSIGTRWNVAWQPRRLTDPYTETVSGLHEAVRVAVDLATERVSWVKVTRDTDSDDVRLYWSSDNGYEWCDRVVAEMLERVCAA